MTKEEKFALVEDLSNTLKETANFYIADTAGMTVAEINDFRRACFKKGLKYKVVKNTLIAKALETLEVDYSALIDSPALKGTSGIIFSPESGSEPAKLIKELTKGSKAENPKPALKAASVESEVYIGAEHLEMLSTIKSKNDLIADVVALLESPALTLLGQLNSGGNTVAGLLKTLEERDAA